MKPRLRLRSTRISITSKLEVGGHELYVIVGFYDNGQPGEVFVKIAKQGSTMSGLMDGWAVLASMLLQSGWAWETIAVKMRHSKFEPNDEKYSSIYDAVVGCVSHAVGEFGGNAKEDYDWPTNGPPIKGSESDGTTSPINADGEDTAPLFQDGKPIGPSTVSSG